VRDPAGVGFLEFHARCRSLSGDLRMGTMNAPSVSAPPASGDVPGNCAFFFCEFCEQGQQAGERVDRARSAGVPAGPLR
jgi:hypothetical protein